MCQFRLDKVSGKLAPADSSRRAELGRRAEALALRHLVAAGLQPVARNFRCKVGEIDLVMRDGKCLVFVEVRCRRRNRFASAVESVDRHKQRKLVRAASFFIKARPRFRDDRMRFDVVALDGVSPGEFRLQWLRDAFRPEGL